MKTKLTYFANFDCLKAFWNSFNKSETINIFIMKAPGGIKGIAQLQVM